MPIFTYSNRSNPETQSGVSYENSNPVFDAWTDVVVRKRLHALGVVQYRQRLMAHHLIKKPHSVVFLFVISKSLSSIFELGLGFHRMDWPSYVNSHTSYPPKDQPLDLR